MVQSVFTLQKSDTAATGWEIVDQKTGKTLDLPSIVKESLDGGSCLSAEEFLKKIDTIQIAVAGVTNSFNWSPDLTQTRAETYLDRNSVLKSVKLKSNGTIDDDIGIITSTDDDSPETIVKQYKAYHTISMHRDKDGDDNSIHAYIQTPKYGELRCVFDKSVRLEAKRNNEKYWIEDYKIDAGSNGGKFVRLIGTPIEILV